MFGYKKMLVDIGMTQEFYDNMMKVCDNIGIVDVKTDLYYKGESNIQGIGIFAAKKINKDDIIGLGSVDLINKTCLSRYTNHSDDKNAIFHYLANDDQVMVAIRDIDKDEEILVDYRDNMLNIITKLLEKIKNCESL